MNRKTLAMLLALFMALTPLFPAFAADSGQTEIVVKPTFGQTDARSMLDMINTFRTGDEAFYWNSTNTEKVSSKGEPLAYSYALEEIAMQRAAEVALSFSHTRPDGTSCFSALASDGSQSWGENIAAGSATASGSFKQWREDDDDYAGQGHRRNMLNPDYQIVGVGHVTLNGTHYWVQEFGYNKDSVPETTALDTERATSVTVSASQLANVESVTVSAESVTVQAGARVAVPTVSASVKLSGAWPGKQTAVDVSPAWTSADTSVCTLDGQEVVGVAAGSTTLSATVLGKPVSVSVTVSGGGGTGGDPAPADGVYAILYNDGTFVFQNGNTPESGKNVKKTYAVDLNTVYVWDYDERTVNTPWFNERESVRVVDFADKISPVSTAYWFYECKSLERVDNIQNLDTVNVTDMAYMFANCNALTALDVSNFNTANVTDMAYMFSDCWVLTALDVSNFDTARVTKMSGMFAYCNALTALDVSRFNTANVTTMYKMFQDCNTLTALDVSHFDTANVKQMASMFANCGRLTALDVSNFNTAGVPYMDEMFSGCGELTALDVSNFDTAVVEDMRAMFEGCSKLTVLDVSHFNTEYVTNMGSMFADCSGLTVLDLSRFDTARVSTMSWMFQGCSNLKTIYAPEQFTSASLAGSSGMFDDCTSLVGGNGTKFDSSHTDKEYARIDTASAPGYFTDKNAPAYAISAVTPDKSAGMLSVTLTNPDAVTVAVSYFTASGQFLSANLRDVSANAGSVEVGLLSNAAIARVTMFDDTCRPVCAAFEAQIG